MHKMGYGIKGIYSLEEYYALRIGKSHNYYEGRAEADLNPFLEYFVEGMAVSLERVKEQAIRQYGLSLAKGEQPAYQTKKLRELRPRQRQALSLFKANREVSVRELANRLGLKSRSTYNLTQQWLKQKFLQVINSSRKNRTYGLSPQWEQLFDPQQKDRLDELKNISFRDDWPPKREQ